jgi:hypothetical protein
LDDVVAVLTLLTVLTAKGVREENAFNEVRSMFSAYNRLSNAKSGLQEGEGD